MPEQIRTREQAKQYLERTFGTDQQFQIFQTEFGWACQKILTPEQIEEGLGLGLGSYVINAHTGVVTAHSSLPPDLIGEMYDEAIRTGQPVQGHQVYPPRWRVNIQRTREDSQEIEYLMEATSLTEPPESNLDHRLVINKQSLSYSPTDRTTARTVAWAEMRNRTDGTWPAQGTFEF